MKKRDVGSKLFYDTSLNLLPLQTNRQLGKCLLPIRRLSLPPGRPQLQFFYPLSYYSYTVKNLGPLKNDKDNKKGELLNPDLVMK